MVMVLNKKFVQKLQTFYFSLPISNSKKYEVRSVPVRNQYKNTDKNLEKISNITSRF